MTIKNIFQKPKLKKKKTTSVVIYVDLMFIGCGKWGLTVKNNSEWKLQG